MGAAPHRREVTMRRFPWALAALLAACLTASPLPASACSCTNNLTTQQEFDYAWKVYSGRVLSVQTDLSGNLIVGVVPIDRWKGPIDYTEVVVTPPNEAVCGFPFEVGQEYLIFATVTYTGITYTPTPFTHLCSRTGLLAGNPYLSELPPPLLPTPTRRTAWGTLKVRYR
jgi:hypothetical protein